MFIEIRYKPLEYKASKVSPLFLYYSTDSTSAGCAFRLISEIPETPRGRARLGNGIGLPKAPFNLDST